MIWVWLSSWISYAFDAVMNAVHVSPVSTLPFGVDAFAVMVVGWVHSSFVAIPLLIAPWYGFLWFTQAILGYYVLRVFRILK